jgi:hypothetical protein
MAQPGNFTPILLYGSSTPGNVPLAANLTNNTTGSEIAINVADKNLFFKDSGGVVNTVPIRQSSTSSNGWLSSTDWTTFNNKGSGTVTSVAALTLGTTGTDLSSTVANGTTTPVITLNVPTASATNRGALSAADWSTFNSKAPAFTYTTGYIPFGQGTTTPTQDAGLFWDNTNKRLGLGTVTPRFPLELVSPLTTTGSLENIAFFRKTTTNQVGAQLAVSDTLVSYGVNAYAGAGNVAVVLRAQNGGVDTNTVYGHPSGGVSIGNTTDPGAGSLYVTNKVISGTALFNTTSNLGFPTVLDGLAASGSNGVFTFKNDAGNNQWLGWMWNNAAGAVSNNLFVSFGTDSTYTGRGSITYNSGASLLAFNTTSDQRLKTNIVDAPSALDKINSIRIRSFNWIETGNHNDFGVIAQELIAVAPEAVTPGDDAKDGQIEKPWAVDTSALNPAMIKAIQELTAKVTALEEQVLNLSVK